MIERGVIVVGTVLSLAAAIVVPLTTDSTDKRLDVAVGAILFVAGAVLTLEFASGFRTRRLADRVEQRLTESDTARFGSLPLQQLLAVPQLQEPIAEIVSAAVHSRTQQSRFVAQRTEERILAYRDDALRVSRGVFRCSNDEEELQLLRGALSETHASVVAVASLGLRAWLTPKFAAYFRTYFDRAGALNITRVFLVASDEASNPEMRVLLEEHEAAGVTAYALKRETLSLGEQRSAVVFDGTFLLKHSRSEATETVDVEFIDNPVQVRDERDHVAALVARAQNPRSSDVLWRPGAFS